MTAIPVPEPFAAALVRRVLAGAGTWCELVPSKGDTPRHNGGCPHESSAVKWEDGFLDVICAWHADDAAKRGVIVLRVED